MDDILERGVTNQIAMDWAHILIVHLANIGYNIDRGDSYDFNQHCIKDGLIKTGIIYGKNSSGKSNFSLAVFDIVAHLADSSSIPGPYAHYINAANNEGMAQFRYVFEFGDDVVDYSYEKTSNRSLVAEMPTLNNEPLMNIKYNSMAITESDYSGIRRIAPSLNFMFYSGGSMLKQTLNNAPLDAEHPLYKMMDFVMRMLWFRGLENPSYMGYRAPADDYYSFINIYDLYRSITDDFDILMHLRSRERDPKIKEVFN